MEKRLPTAIIVLLAQLDQKPNDDAELTYTDNLSAHGACVISKRRWEVGETVEVTSLQDQTTLRGKVVHCEKRGDNCYYIGLSFLDPSVTWSTSETSSGAGRKRDGEKQQFKPLVANIASD